MKAMRLEMPLYGVLAKYADGDQRGWGTEFLNLWAYHEKETRALIEDIRENGILKPILLGNDGRVWDGHHRLCAADYLGLAMVPVEFA